MGLSIYCEAPWPTHGLARRHQQGTLPWLKVLESNPPDRAASPTNTGLTQSWRLEVRVHSGADSVPGQAAFLASRGPPSRRDLTRWGESPGVSSASGDDSRDILGTASLDRSSNPHPFPKTPPSKTIPLGGGQVVHDACLGTETLCPEQPPCIKSLLSNGKIVKSYTTTTTVGTIGNRCVPGNCSHVSLPEEHVLKYLQVYV